MEKHILKHAQTGHGHAHDHQEAERQNRFGVSVIVFASAFVGLGIFVLGWAADVNSIVMTVGAGILFLSLIALIKIKAGRK
jgi:hypothetical protein